MASESMMARRAGRQVLVDINILPPELRPVGLSRLSLVLLGVSGLALLSFLFAFQLRWGTQMQIDQMSARTRAAQDTVSRFARSQQEASELQGRVDKAKASLKELQEDYRAFQAQRVSWAAVMAAVVGNATETSFGSIKLAQADAKGTLEGMAASSEAVASYARALVASNLFAKVTIRSIVAGGREVVPIPSPGLPPIIFTPEATPTVEGTPTVEATPTLEPTATATATSTPQPTPTITPTPTSAPTATPVPTATNTPTATATPLSSVSEFWVTRHPARQAHPAVSVSTVPSTVVWVDYRNDSNGDIYQKSLPSGAELPVSTNPARQGYPAISGNIVVWVDYRNGNEDIYGKNLSTGAEFAVVTHSASQGFPAISGNLVVWQDDRNGNWDIYGKNLSTGAEFAVVTNRAQQTAPAISGNFAVWQDDRNAATTGWDIYIKDLSTGAESPVTTHPAEQEQPALFISQAAAYVVWRDNRNGNWDIYGKDLNNGTDFAVTTVPADQRYPAISGSIAVWQDNRSGNWDIYGKNLCTGLELPITTNGAAQERPAISGSIVVWEDGRDGDQGNIYGAQLRWWVCPAAPLSLSSSPSPGGPLRPSPGPGLLSMPPRDPLPQIDIPIRELLPPLFPSPTPPRDRPAPERLVPLFQNPVSFTIDLEVRVGAD